ncbi:hypothetical protein C7448_11111 [Tenacibaculum gallaicum]|uniref:Uncharacterized protein n=1 Tax=Tenacibaculum gallaicum TaxID=561505 RepID=A0A3E0HFI3_9FLAO|nr:hypothetical protein [Tenacibaculum gallaicum]REH44479.1 hypothetical protein C7448_11111 [Tenacibaculum gallaicum]
MLKPIFYYQRRLFLTVLYIIGGLLFLSFPIMGVLEPSSKQELEYINDEPDEFSVDYEKRSNDEYIKLLVIKVDNKVLRAVIDNNQYKLLVKSLGEVRLEYKEKGIIIKTPVKEIELKNTYIQQQNLKNISVEAYHANGTVRDLKINKVNIIIFKETSKFLYILLIVFGILWLLWQVRILFYIIKNKPENLYK